MYLSGYEFLSCEQPCHSLRHHTPETIRNPTGPCKCRQQSTLRSHAGILRGIISYFLRTNTLYSGRLVLYFYSFVQETLQLAVPEEHWSAVGSRDAVRYNFTKVLDDNSTQEVWRLSEPMVEVSLLVGFANHRFILSACEVVIPFPSTRHHSSYVPGTVVSIWGGGKGAGFETLLRGTYY